MWSLISSFIVGTVMQSIAVTSILAQYQLRLLLTYDDDTFIIIKYNDLENFHAIINFIDTNIKFPRENEQTNQLPSLDVLVRRQWVGKLNTTVYRKRSTSGVIVHYSSNHPTNFKRICVKTSFDRAWLYSFDKLTLTPERSYFLNMFSNCGYLLFFVRRLMRHNAPPW